MKECSCPNKTLFKKIGSTLRLADPGKKDGVNGGHGESLWEMDKRYGGEAYLMLFHLGILSMLPNYLTSKKSFWLTPANCNDSFMLISSASMSRVCWASLCSSKSSFSCSPVLPLCLEIGSSQGAESPPLASLVRY